MNDPRPLLLTFALRGGGWASRCSGRGKGKAAQRQPRILLGFLIHNLEHMTVLLPLRSGWVGAEAVTAPGNGDA